MDYTRKAMKRKLEKKAAHNTRFAASYDTLKDFRPQLSFPNIKCVVLTKYYNSLLNRFLGDKHYELGTGNIMSPARSKGEREKRMQFLGNYFKIWYGHWGGYWQLYSYPYASKITFDRLYKMHLLTMLWFIKVAMLILKS